MLSLERKLGITESIVPSTGYIWTWNSEHFRVFPQNENSFPQQVTPLSQDNLFHQCQSVLHFEQNFIRVRKKNEPAIISVMDLAVVDYSQLFSHRLSSC
jgi:hypothetical protein